VFRSSGTERAGWVGRSSPNHGRPGSPERGSTSRTGIVFGCGSVGISGRHDNHREDVWRFHVRRLSDLSHRIIPLFEANPLRTAKAGDFAGFAAVVRLMEERAHLTEAGLLQIAGVGATMNRRKRSQLVESSETIRQPSRLDGRDEDMVLAPWRHGGS